MTFDPNERGRGPSRLKSWYFVQTTDDPGFIAQFMWVDASNRIRGEHLLTFRPWDMTEGIEVPYAQLVGVKDLERCPQCRAARPSLMRRAAGDWHCLECGHDQAEDPVPVKPNRAEYAQRRVLRAALRKRQER